MNRKHTNRCFDHLDFLKWRDKLLAASPEFKGLNDPQLYEIYSKEVLNSPSSKSSKADKETTLESKKETTLESKKESALEPMKENLAKTIKSKLLVLFPIKIKEAFNISDAYYHDISGDINESIEIFKKIKKPQLKARIIKEILDAHKEGLKLKIIDYINETNKLKCNLDSFNDSELKQLLDSSMEDCSDILMELMLENNPDLRGIEGVDLASSELKIRKSVKWSDRIK
tara:strand:- start:757 stop:1443 length:687 start_codon:yes stop_codon:yes gene_type:complete